MMDETKFKGKYRIPSARWDKWDYGSNAPYFVTICTHKRVNYFGVIRDNEMFHRPIGLAAIDCWHAIPDHFPFVRLGAFVVMPNHMHGIIIIDKPDPINVETQNLASFPKQETQDFASLRPQGPMNRFGPQSKNLASIVRGYKIGVTKYSNEYNISFKWQARFHDHVIRDEAEYNRIHHYIETNPENWDKDSLNPKKIM